MMGLGRRNSSGRHTARDRHARRSGSTRRRLGKIMTKNYTAFDTAQLTVGINGGDHVALKSFWRNVLVFDSKTVVFLITMTTTQIYDQCHLERAVLTAKASSWWSSATAP